MIKRFQTQHKTIAAMQRAITDNRENFPAQTDRAPTTNVLRVKKKVFAVESRQIYPFLQTEKSEQEIATIERFDEIRKKLLAGEKYFNQSTPVDGLLTYMSAVISEDAEAYKKSIAMKFGGPISFHASWKKRCRSICIYRVPPWPENPSEGDVHPIYVMDKELDDVHVYVYHEGRWIQLFNEGNPETDWRESVDRVKKMVLK